MAADFSNSPNKYLSVLYIVCVLSFPPSKILIIFLRNIYQDFKREKELAINYIYFEIIKYQAKRLCLAVWVKNKYMGTGMYCEKRLPHLYNGYQSGAEHG